MSDIVTLEMVKEAAERLKDVARMTPIVSAKPLSENVFFKAENLQRTGSFKLRGAYNRISMLTDEEASHGVVASSAGNHAQGVAVSATEKGVKSVICMPSSAPDMKVAATKGYGADVVLVPGNFEDSAAEAERLQNEEGYTYIHPFDDPLVIAGQGTIGLEILEQMPDVEQIIVPVGGGGLVSGVAVAVKSVKPECRVIGVQAAVVPSMYGSYAFSEIISIPDSKTFADGIHVLRPGKNTFDIINEYVDDIVTVEEDEICAAIVSLMEGPKLVAEGAGASSYAAFMYNKVDTSLKTVCIVSGGNVDISTLDVIMDIGEEKMNRKHTRTKILCYGDSNTYGYNPNEGWRSRYPKSKRWTSILQDRLGSGYEIIPEGLNGRTTAYDRVGFPWKNGLKHLAPVMGTHKPIDIILFMLGTNDCNIELGLTLKDISEGMESLVCEVENVCPAQQTSVPKIIIVSPAAIRDDYKDSPFCDSLCSNSVKMSHDLADEYKKIAYKHNCIFIDATESVEVSSIDSMHLSETGHKQLADLVFNVINEKRL